MDGVSVSTLTAHRRGVPGLLATRGWFEPTVATAALSVGAGARVLAICGAGDVAFALAAGGATVHAVDVRLAQLAYARLALAGVRALPASSTRSMLGMAHFGRRLWFYHHVRASLDDASRNFWDTHEGALRLGIVDQGSVERRVATLRTRVLPVAVPSGVLSAVLAAPTISEQGQLFRERWDTWRWHASLRMAFAPLALASVGLNSPRLAAVGADYSTRFAARVRRVFDTVLVGRHPGLRWALTGVSDAEGTCPTWLDGAHYEALRARAGDIAFVHGRLLDALRAPPDGGWNAFFLGDALEELGHDAVLEVLEHVVRGAAPGARVVSWRLGGSYARSASLARHLVRDEAASALASAHEPIPAWSGVDVETVLRAG
ncbi:MAG: DUF3419 family protein [Myxococcales bacterium]|nr:DUF3419 family protein [Myxococcales bacterium]